MPTLASAVETFCLIDRSPFTNKNYRNILERMVSAIGAIHDLEVITDTQLLVYVQHLKNRGLKRTSLNQHILVIKVFFNWCLKRGYITTSPAVVLAVRPANEPPEKSRAIPAEVLTAMIEQVRYHPRNHAVLLFMADTGCRVGGIASLTLENLHIEDRTATLREKGGRWHRAYFGDQTAAALQRWLSVRPKVDTNAVFVSSRKHPLSRKSIADLVRRLSMKVTGGEFAYGPHSIRHAVGHAMANAGVAVSITARKLGHDPRISLERYYPQHDAAVREASEKHSLAALKSSESHRDTTDKPQPSNIVSFDQVRRTK